MVTGDSAVIKEPVNKNENKNENIEVEIELKEKWAVIFLLEEDYERHPHFELFDSEEEALKTIKKRIKETGKDKVWWSDGHLETFNHPVGVVGTDGKIHEIKHVDHDPYRYLKNKTILILKVQQLFEKI